MCIYIYISLVYQFIKFEVPSMRPSNRRGEHHPTITYREITTNLHIFQCCF